MPLPLLIFSRCAFRYAAALMPCCRYRFLRFRAADSCLIFALFIAFVRLLISSAIDKAAADDDAAFMMLIFFAIFAIDVLSLLMLSSSADTLISPL